MHSTDLACKHCFGAACGLEHTFALDDCSGCRARHASRSPEFLDSKKAGRLTSEYLRLLDDYEITHADVRAAREADAINRSPMLV